MADAWAAAVLSAGAAVLVGRRHLQRHLRRERHARVAAWRLQGQAEAELAHLAERHRALEEDLHRAFGTAPPEQPDSIFGPDLIGELHRVLLAELEVWAKEAGEELAGLRGRHLRALRAALVALRAEIRDLCAEIAAREARWKARSGAQDDGSAGRLGPHSQRAGAPSLADPEGTAA